MVHYEQVFGNVFKRKESKCCAVLMKYRPKVKGEHVITLQIAQQLKAKNVVMIKVNFHLLQILQMNLLCVKHQSESSNQLAFHLSAYIHL